MLERDIFIEAVEKETAAERAAYLDTACGADDDLRCRVERLLADHDRQNTCFVDATAPAVLASAVRAASAFAEAGGTVGPYKLLEPIGEGGYGVVFMAEQQTPVLRRVALKIIKPGMDTKQVITRFEAERQALAIMDHPNIARVFDAGVTESGRPYFVMELVKGVPITKYCDEHCLTPRQRVELFVQVCQAVQHAHQKGIIHRDIKPTNVLVAQYDGKPVPKVIDFGVAKATGQRLTDATMFTGFGDVIGTPQYMSPEQAELNQLDVDTRSDIYSLGVLLYELLTGTTPLESRRVRDVSLLEVLRAVREEEPPRPSTRLTTSAELPAIAAQRNLEPKGLSAVVRGELDWIVMKALEKDRSRRYETASGFAADVQRYLDDEPVLACPPSARYRFRKFARRHGGALWAGAVALTALLVLLVGLAVSNRIIAAERNEKARALQEKGQALTDARDSARRAEMQRQRADNDLRRARTAVSAVLTDPGLGEGEWSQMPPALQRRLLEQATKYYKSLVHEDASDPSLLYETAVGYRWLAYLHARARDYSQADSLLRKSASILQKLSDDYPREPKYRQQLAWSNALVVSTLAPAKPLAEVQSTLEKSREVYDDLLREQPRHPDYLAESLSISYWIAHVHRRRQQFNEAEAAYRRAIDFHARLLELPTPPEQVVSCAESYRELITLLAMRGAAHDALDVCARWPGLNSVDHEAWRAVVAVQAWEGDVEGYRRSCQAMLKLFENPDRPEVAERTAKCCSLMPISAGDVGRAAALADRALKAERNTYYRYFLGAKGMVEYRAGNDAAALRWIDRAAPNPARRDEYEAEVLCFRAMALHRLGRRDEARAALRSAESILPKPPEGAEGVAKQDGAWLWWLPARILHREAASLIGAAD